MDIEHFASGFAVFAGLTGFAIAILGTVFWVMMLIEVLTKARFKTENEKIIWVLVVVLLGIIGAAIYYFTIRKQALTEGSVS